MAENEARSDQPYALIIATDTYDDRDLRELRSPSRDADEFAAVLKDPEIGGFNVQTVVNGPGDQIREEIEGFFTDRSLDDLLVLYISCHGVKDASGRLYFTTQTTKLSRLAASGISSEFVYEQVDRCRARRILLLLDCCYSGAYLMGHRSRAADRATIKALDGTGRAVITSSTAVQYAFEIDTGEITGTAAPSVFTAALVEGLRSGDADRDGNGLISVDDLYAYAYDRVREITPHQTPEKKWGDFRGDFIIAKNPHAPAARREALPTRLVNDLQSPFSSVREIAIRELAAMAFGTRQGLARTAQEALQTLANDDTLKVSAAAMAALFERSPRREDALEVPHNSTPDNLKNNSSARRRFFRTAAGRLRVPTGSPLTATAGKTITYPVIDELPATDNAQTTGNPPSQVRPGVFTTFTKPHHISDELSTGQTDEPYTGQDPARGDGPSVELKHSQDNDDSGWRQWRWNPARLAVVTAVLATLGAVGYYSVKIYEHGRPSGSGVGANHGQQSPRNGATRSASPSETPKTSFAPAGIWAGQVRQPSPPDAFSVRISLAPRVQSGTVYYSSASFSCSGKLSWVSAAGTTITMHQGITSGRTQCANGTVTLQATSTNKIAFAFQGSAGPAATGTLAKQ